MYYPFLFHCNNGYTKATHCYFIRTLSCLRLKFGTGVLHLFQINQQPDAILFQFIILRFVYSSTCFGRFSAYHQELNDCSGSLWFYLHIVVTVVLSAGTTTNTARLSPRYEGKTRAVIEFLMMGGKLPKHVEL